MENPGDTAGGGGRGPRGGHRRPGTGARAGIRGLATAGGPDAGTARCRVARAARPRSLRALRGRRTGSTRALAERWRRRRGSGRGWHRGRHRGARRGALPGTDGSPQPDGSPDEAGGDRDVWIQALLERAAEFCGRAALFAIRGKTVRYEGSLGVEDESAGPVGEIPLESAPAFANAVESKDTVVALATASQLSEPVTRCSASMPDAASTCSPLRTAAQSSGCSTPSRRRADRRQRPRTAHGFGGDDHRTGDPGLPRSRRLDPDLRAARPKDGGLCNGTPCRGRTRNGTRAPSASPATGWRRSCCTRSTRCGPGGRSHDLYAALKEDIDAGREAFREQFLQAAPGVPDYFHAELVRTLAKDDAGLLGAAYPGALA